MNQRWKLVLAFTIAACLTSASQVIAAPPWTNPRYLYRYFFWGIPSEFSKSDDWKLFPYHTIDNAPPAFHFTAGAAGLLPETVEYHDGDTLKRVALDELLRSTGTHAFIVIRDDQLLYEDYFNGYQRDSICVSRSVAKSFTSALVGIAIQDGFIKSVDDPITDYLPELKGQPGFDSITIKNLLTMGSGIRYRLHDFPWDEEPVAYFYPDLTKLMLSDLRIVEPPGQSFHYNDYNTELLGLILKRVTHQSPSEYLQEKIWKPLGMEYPATWSIDSEEDGLELMYVLLNARAIDFAKFGRLFLNNGNWNGKQIIPQRWVIESTTRDPNDNRPWETYPDFPDGGGYYKYFWWGRTFGADDYIFEAQGLWGQYIFICPKTKVVIVRTASKWGSIGAGGWNQVMRYIATHVGERSTNAAAPRAASTAAP
jgi:CubicO group peptidase (beta-lactamase class C family)